MTESIVELARRLVTIDTVNPALVPGGAGERECVHALGEWCDAHGLDVQIVGEDARPSLIARTAKRDGRSLLLNGHLDTVGVAGMRDPFEPRIEDGRLYGRGSYDMKGAIAALCVAAAECEGNIIVTAVADEELASIGTEEILRHVSADAALVAEPTELQVAVAHRGFVGFEIETAGVAAHGSRPDLGVDAIAAAGVILTRLDQLARDLLAREPHPLLATPSAHASLISGGQEFSSYPERCLIQGERRTLPGETDAEIAAEVAALAAGVDATTRLVFSRPPLETDPSHKLAHAVAQAAGTASFEGVPFWTDGALFAAAGIPTVIFGPRGTGAHAAEEWVEVESLSRCAEVYAESVRLLATAG